MRDRLFISLSQCGYRDGETLSFKSLSRFFANISFRLGQPLVCCKDEPASPPPTQPPPPPPPAVTNAPPPASVNDPYILLPKPGSPACGNDFTNRIFGGNVTEIDEYPWTVLLGYSKRKYKEVLNG
jgi:hypothetical protein